MLSFLHVYYFPITVKMKLAHPSLKRLTKLPPLLVLNKRKFYKSSKSPLPAEPSKPPGGLPSVPVDRAMVGEHQSEYDRNPRTRESSSSRNSQACYETGHQRASYNFRYHSARVTLRSTSRFVRSFPGCWIDDDPGVMISRLHHRYCLLLERVKDSETLFSSRRLLLRADPTYHRIIVSASFHLSLRQYIFARIIYLFISYRRPVELSHWFENLTTRMEIP